MQTFFNVIRCLSALPFAQSSFAHMYTHTQTKTLKDWTRIWKSHTLKWIDVSFEFPIIYRFPVCPSSLSLIYYYYFYCLKLSWKKYSFCPVKLSKVWEPFPVSLWFRVTSSFTPSADCENWQLHLQSWPDHSSVSFSLEMHDRWTCVFPSGGTQWPLFRFCDISSCWWWLPVANNSSGLPGGGSTSFLLQVLAWSYRSRETSLHQCRMTRRDGSHGKGGISTWFLLFI